MGEVLDAITDLTRDGAEASFEDLPCMALIERGGMVIARNALTRSLTGQWPDAASVEEVLLGAYDFQAQARRYRFDCLMIRRGGPPIQVSAVLFKEIVIQ